MRRKSLVGGTVDLGAIATEFLILGLDPYPRKTGRRVPGAGRTAMTPRMPSPRSRR